MQIFLYILISFLLLIWRRKSLFFFCLFSAILIWEKGSDKKGDQDWTERFQKKKGGLVRLSISLFFSIFHLYFSLLWPLLCESRPLPHFLLFFRPSRSCSFPPPPFFFLVTVVFPLDWREGKQNNQGEQNKREGKRPAVTWMSRSTSPSSSSTSGKDSAEPEWETKVSHFQKPKQYCLNRSIDMESHDRVSLHASLLSATFLAILPFKFDAFLCLLPFSHLHPL